MFTLTVATVDTLLYQGEARSLTAPGAEGELTVLGSHEPFVTPLREGELVIRDDGASEPTTISIQSGLLEVSANQATVLL